jgi:hypothetical protein
MSLRFTTIALASVLLLAAGSVSTVDAQLLGSRPLALPITGTVSGGANFVGTINIRNFAVQQGVTVAVAAISGAIVDASGVQARTGLRANAVFPVSVSAAAGVSGAAFRPFNRSRAFAAPGFVLASQACGSAAHVEIGASNVNLMGVDVMMNPIVLDVGADSGGLIGSLVCQILGLLGNPTMVTSLLNQLLAQLVGLTGGLGGGLLL